MDIKILAFDLDDTLHDFKAAMRRAMAVVYDMLQQEYQIAPERAAAVHSLLVAQDASSGFACGASSSEYRRRRFSKMLECFDVVPGPIVGEMLRCYQAELDGVMRLNAGAENLLTSAKAAGLTTVVVTEGPRDAQEHALVVLGISQLVDHLFTAGAEGVSKLDGLFERVVARLGCAPREMLYIGDSLERDVLPAQQAGLRTMLYCTGAPPFVGHLEVQTIADLSLVAQEIGLPGFCARGTGVLEPKGSGGAALHVKSRVQ